MTNRGELDYLTFAHPVLEVPVLATEPHLTFIGHIHTDANAVAAARDPDLEARAFVDLGQPGFTEPVEDWPAPRHDLAFPFSDGRLTRSQPGFEHECAHDDVLLSCRAGSDKAPVQVLPAHLAHGHYVVRVRIPRDERLGLGQVNDMGLGVGAIRVGLEVVAVVLVARELALVDEGGGVVVRGEDARDTSKLLDTTQDG